MSPWSSGRASRPPASDALSVGGLAACLVALASGTTATLYQKRHGDGIPLVWGTAVQYAAASTLLLALAVATESMRIDWTPEFVGALVWLVLVLSLGAVLLLLLLLRRGTASGVSSLLYLVPPAVAVEAFLLFGERLSPPALVGVAVTAVGVALVVSHPARRGSAPSATGMSPSWATVATCVPSTAQICPKQSARPRTPRDCRSRRGASRRRAPARGTRPRGRGWRR